MLRPKHLPQSLYTNSETPGEVPRGGSVQYWVAAILVVVALLAVAFNSSHTAAIREALVSGADKVAQHAAAPPPPPPLQRPKAAVPDAQVAVPKPPARPVPQDDLARPLEFYFARWGVAEALSPIGWTSRVEIRASAKGGAVARIWVTCPKGVCDGGELPVNVVAHLQKKDMTAFLGIERREPDRVWTLLLRPAPGRPDELERWEWYGPPGSNVRTQSLLGHVRRIQADGTSR